MMLNEYHGTLMMLNEYPREVQAANRQKLIEILEKVPPEDFAMREFAERKEEHECGTVACALGHAAISGQFEGLSFAFVERPSMIYPNEMLPAVATALVDGGEVDWDVVGVSYFGRKVTWDVFYGMYQVGRGYAAKRAVIDAISNIEGDDA